VKRLAIAIALVVAPALHAGSVTASKAALSTATPVATQVGLNVLKRGGNAADAAVAVAFTLAVSHPQAGNLGGGGFLVYYDAETKGIWTLDFREVAPLTATRDMFASDASAARTGARAAAIPGSVAGLDAMHRRFGSRPWKELLEPSIRLAREGIRVDAELQRDLEAAKADRKIEQCAATNAIFYAGKTPLVQSELATTLQRLADAGARDFYDGDIAKKLVEAVRAAGGHFGHRDLREYQPVWRAPIKLRFGDYDLYTVAPPSGGGLVIGETLNILSGFDLAASGFQSTKSLHLIVEAQRRAYYDRNKYLGDPSSTRIPYRELLSNERAAQWRKSIDPALATATPTLVEPHAAEGEHTTHFTIADEQGNIVSLTTTLGENFGSGFVVPGLGFFLNNAMDDFTTAPKRANRDGLVQANVNAIEPARRVASSLAPTIVLRGGKPFLALGTRGGPAIPTTIVQVFLNLVIYRKSLQDAISAPRWHQQDAPEELDYERDRAPQTTVDALNAMGHGVRARDAIGDVHAILFRDGKLTAVSDPRRGGAAGGY
jgi:gamma-glutamyltranspeptidase/glutathione hydrolase